MKRAILAVGVMLPAMAGMAGAQQSKGALVVGPVSAAPASTVSGSLDVPARGGDSGTTIPITVINGATPGPVLALVAGTHGMEYVPIIAMQRVRRAIDPRTLRGAVIIVQVANMPSFLGRTIYYSPADGKNLNRVFPGKADGTLSERIADVITREVIARATHLVDLHCGDGNESLRPYTYWITTGDPKVAAAGREMALAFGLGSIVIDGARPTDPAASVYLSNTAITRGKPAITTEAGGLAVVDEESIRLIEGGVERLLVNLGMTLGSPPPHPPTVWIGQNEVVRAGVTGIFWAEATRGQMVKKGEALGRITDFHGLLLERLVAPFDGEVLYVIGTPPITKGEPIAMVGVRK
jgi:predicted deacylase